MKARWELVLLPPLFVSLLLLLSSQLVFLTGSLHKDLGIGLLAPAMGFDNFREVLTDPYFLSSLWLSIRVSTNPIPLVPAPTTR